MNISKLFLSKLEAFQRYEREHPDAREGDGIDLFYEWLSSERFAMVALSGNLSLLPRAPGRRGDRWHKRSGLDAVIAFVDGRDGVYVPDPVDCGHSLIFVPQSWIEALEATHAEAK
jgi:hypothetical protein